MLLNVDADAEVDEGRRDDTLASSNVRLVDEAEMRSDERETVAAV